ncbi:hypothetical protein M4951_01790 [Blastopirellula sp. J2-11]|uniref:hypothetical protein n=1 Tax=Blastopirellula sp. J2-11 TaxID=2943192 RepID=UPI0021C5CBCB|nr:hypothetical protein [Blastopirellula sp. J2-11]UUO07056.1 hypothetical protein M4951_01790 [Blastopirellula sp. J2-11]
MCDNYLSQLLKSLIFAIVICLGVIAEGQQVAPVADVENNSSDASGFLTNAWRDGFGIFGAVGTVVTIGSLLIAARQIYLTRTANKAATKAAVKAFKVARELYQKRIISDAEHIAREIPNYVDRQEHLVVALQISELSRSLTQIISSDPSWETIASSLKGLEHSHRRIALGTLTFTPTIRKDTNKILTEVQLRLAKRGTLFDTDQTSDLDNIGE